MPNLIGTAPNQVPTNGALGNMAFQNKEAVSVDTLVTTALTVTGTGALTVGGTQIVKDASGNLGLGVVPSAWGSGLAALELKNGTSLFNAGGSSQTLLSANAYFNGTNWIYKNTNAASYYNQTGGAHAWNTAPSGTAGTAISFTQAMTLDTSGNLGIGTSSPGAKLDAIGVIRSKNASGDVGGLRFWSDVSGNGNIFEYYNASLIFGTGDTERMRIDSSGNVGIGAVPKSWQAFPVNTMQIGGAMAVSGYTASGNRQANIWCNAYLNTSGALTYMNTDAASAYRQLTGVHAWYSAPSGTADTALTFTQTMTLNASGNLGLGITSPVAVKGTTIDVRGTAGGSVRFGTSSGVTGSVSCDDSILTLGSGNPIPITFNTSDTERMRISSTGDVGIGTTSPGYKLDVSQGGSVGAVIDVARVYANVGSTATPRLLFGSAANEVSAAIGAQTTAATTGDLTFYTETAGALTERMRLDSNGNVGIGTNSIATDASLQLHKTSASAYTALKITNGATGAGNLDGFDLITGPSSEAYLYNRENSYMVFGTNNTERARIDSSGNLGVGTTSTSSWRTRISNTTNQTLSLQNSAGTGTRIQLVDTTWGGEIEQNAGAMIFKIGGTTEAMRIASDGKVGIGTTGATALLDVNADTVRVRTAKTPASATATGNAGDICWDSNYVYVCVATNTWKRSALSTW